jgi:dipeptidyl aminopeptidase/acylaminoacyl peptidase
MRGFRKRHLALAILVLIGCVVVYFIINFPWVFERQNYPGVYDVKILSDQLVWEAKWSPDGAKIAMKTQKRRDVTAPVVLRILDVEKQTIEQVPISAEKLSPTNKFVLGYLDWSPDGEYLTISGNPADKPEHHGIWILNLLTYDMKMLTKGRYFAWSPNGNRIAIIQEKTLKILHVEDNQEYSFQLLKTVDNIDWSPQGDRLVVSSPEADGQGYRVDRLYIIDIEREDIQAFLSDSFWSMRKPIWLPDGDWISFIIKNVPEGGVIAAAPTTGQCIFSWFPELKRIDSIDITKDGKKLLVVSWGDLKIVDIEKAGGQHLLPENLVCP